jgi:hypothetical protein
VVSVSQILLCYSSSFSLFKRPKRRPLTSIYIRDRVDRVSPGQFPSGFLPPPGPVPGLGRSGQPAGPVRVLKLWDLLLVMVSGFFLFFLDIILTLSDFSIYVFRLDPAVCMYLGDLLLGEEANQRYTGKLIILCFCLGAEQCHLVMNFFL